MTKETGRLKKVHTQKHNGKYNPLAHNQSWTASGRIFQVNMEKSQKKKKKI